MALCCAGLVGEQHTRGEGSAEHQIFMVCACDSRHAETCKFGANLTPPVPLQRACQLIRFRAVIPRARFKLLANPRHTIPPRVLARAQSAHDKSRVPPPAARPPAVRTVNCALSHARCRAERVLLVGPHRPPTPLAGITSCVLHCIPGYSALRLTHRSLQVLHCRKVQAVPLLKFKPLDFIVAPTTQQIIFWSA